MHQSIALWFLLLLLTILFLMVAGLVYLLVNPRTRRVAIALLLLLPLTILMLSVVTVWFGRGPHVTHIRQLGTLNEVPQQVEVAHDEHQEDASPPSLQLAEEPPSSPDRPAWIDQPADRDAEGNYVMPIAVGPYTTRVECENELPKEIATAVAWYVAMAVGPEARGRVHLSPDYVQEHVVRARWEEWRDHEPPLGRMVTLHVLLTFDRDAQATLQNAWKHVVVERRLWSVGMTGGMVLLVLAAAWGYLKVDMRADPK